MAYGFEIYDASGVLLLNLSKRVPRYLGTISTGTTDGSYADARLAGGTPFFITTSQLFESGISHNYPVVSISTSGLTWSWRNTTNKLASTIIYGFT